MNNRFHRCLISFYLVASLTIPLLLGSQSVRAAPATPAVTITGEQLNSGDPDIGNSGSAIIGDARHLAPIRWSFNPMQYSAGYVLGTLTGVHKNGIVIQTLEGYVKLGQASETGGYVNLHCFDREKRKLKTQSSTAPYQAELQAAEQRCTVEINPFPFSNQDQDLIGNLSGIGSSEVVLYYRSYFWVPFVESNNYLQRVYLVDPTVLPPRASYTAPIPLLQRIWLLRRLTRWQTGFYVGRIVKASLDNVVRKAREIVIQQGVGGSIYNEVAVPNQKLFNFMLKAMASGRYVRVYYYYLIGPISAPENLFRGYNNEYRAYKIELLN